ncbi:MAG: DUF447 family protein [archaeon]|nr:DUF447 family protein [archaeon]
MPKVNSLSDLGFIKNCVFEVIVSTYGINHVPNAAPMGIMTDDMQRFIMKPYTTSQTYRNIFLQKCAVINIISNSIIYYKTAFKDANPDKRVPIDWFEKADLVDAPKLKNADTCIEVKAINIENKKRDRAKVLCEVVDISHIINIVPKAYCRANFALIESIIHATRINVFLSKDEKEKVEGLIKLIKYYDTLVERVAPSSVYSDIMKEILKRIEDWKAKSEI